MYILRDYQQRVVDKIIAFCRSKERTTKKPVIVAPTGVGKSLLLAAAIHELNEPTLILQPSKELLIQNYEKYISYGNEASICSASVGMRDIGTVTFSTIGTILPRIHELKEQGVKNIFIDEAHLHSKKDGRVAALLHAMGKGICVMGFTATPVELRSTFGMSDLQMINRSRKNLFNSILDVVQVKEMVEGGWWCPIEYDVYEMDESGLVLNTAGTEYTEESVEKFYKTNTVEEKILELLDAIEFSNPKANTLIFAPNIASAEALAEKIGAGCVHSKMSKGARDTAIREFVTGKNRVMVNCAILAVGFDFPALDTIIMTRPTNSFAVYYQQIGRGVRPHPSKEKATVVCMSGNHERFGGVDTVEFKEINGAWDMFSGGKKLTNIMNQTSSPPKNKFIIENITCMPYGKWEGVPFNDVPDEYLRWVVSNFDMKVEKSRSIVMSIKKYFQNKSEKQLDYIPY